jgi:hypothetical protein
VKADEETSRQSLEGDWREEHLFTLSQSWQMHVSYVHAIEECDQRIMEFPDALGARRWTSRKILCRRITSGALAEIIKELATRR